MTYDDLRCELERLVETYVSDALERGRLLILVKADEIPVKGILSDLNHYMPDAISDSDADVIKEIVFNFC
ncbi:hypothetical protein PCO31010_04536 [Pandoraea commovens]|uniref:Uncharacterized protein n=1 Tax=Pandoraea commovens TaxID=2508289 RepID=A0A5E4YHA9_9BURK|nr:hypothetical protein PCO31010_04536 [Pandoraea commovens]